MSLKINNVFLSDFRNIQTLNLTVNEGLNLIIGKNASGKTNLLEALSLLTTGESFRSSSVTELIRFNKNKSIIKANLSSSLRDIEIKIILDSKKNIFINNKNASSEQLKKYLPSVAFTPNDLSLIKKGSKYKRDALDRLGVVLHSNYYEILKAFERALSQRNVLLKQKLFSDDLLLAWTDNLVINGALLSTYRYALFLKLFPYIQENYKYFSTEENISGDYSFSYLPGKNVEINKENLIEAYKEQLRLDLEEEKQRGVTLSGPQRDEIRLYLNEKDTRKFSSQGQQRSMVLAWKVAEIEIIKEYIDYYPLLLLDDVMSELDNLRRNQLLELIDGRIQTFITATTEKYFSEKYLKKSNIVRLEHGK